MTVTVTVTGSGPSAPPRPPRSARAGRLRADTVPISRLAPADVTRMFALFETYYDHTTSEQFEHDLRAKHRVIVLRDHATRSIEGFCTLRDLDMEIGGRRVYGVFTGDTIISPAYWGQSALTWAFFTYLLRGKLRHPAAPYYWFLISKGYKTYLLLTNYMHRHYPRFEQATPPLEQAVIDAFADALYPGRYDRATGLIDCGDAHERLREHVAPISNEMLDHPRIRFFADRNPTWQRGTELCCIGELTWQVPLRLPLRVLGKAARGWVRRLLRRGASERAG